MTTKKTEKNSLAQLCPVRNVVSRFGNKWSMLVLLLLEEKGRLRFNELGRLIPDISAKVLSTTLRTLEADALVSRTVYPEVPIRVEYALTDTGRELVPLIQGLTDWALRNMPTIIRHRQRYERAGA